MRGLIREARGTEIVRRKADGDVTRRFDTLVEDRLIRLLEESRLPVRVHSEERETFDLVQSPELLAIIDPVDGSDMLAQGYPLCSIAFCLIDLASGAPVLSRICEIATGCQLSASDGVARRDGMPISPSRVERLESAFVVLYGATPHRLSGMCGLLDILGDCRLVLNYGGPLDIAKVGSGQCDLFIETVRGFKAMDYVPGIHIATSAGAVAAQLDGSEVPFGLAEHARVQFVVAATPELHAEVMARLRALGLASS